MKISDLPAPPVGRTGWPWTDTATPSLRIPPSLWPRISIVTPSFNQAAFLEETIRSVLLQGYPNLQYIVIDGGSTDGSVEIIHKYAPWIDYWVSEPDRGQSHAINKGLARATGEWFNWINSDDYLAPGALFALAQVVTRTPQLVIISGITANLRGQEVFSRYSAKVPDTWPSVLFNLHVNQPGSLLNLPAVRVLGGITEDLNLVMDLDLWIRLLRNHGPRSFAQVETETAVYRYHADSKTCAGDDVFALEEFALITDLVTSTSTHAYPASIAGLRTGVKHQPVVADKKGLQFDSHTAERAWLDRLVVSDSLLFRALRQSQTVPANSLPAFASLLDELTPMLNRHHDASSVRGILANALLHAMQTQRRFSWRWAGLAIRRAPSIKTVRALTRLALFP